MNEWMTPDELSALIRVPRATLYVWRHRGKGPKSVVVGNHLRYRRAGVDSWLASLER